MYREGTVGGHSREGMIFGYQPELWNAAPWYSEIVCKIFSGSGLSHKGTLATRTDTHRVPLYWAMLMEAFCSFEGRCAFCPSVAEHRLISHACFEHFWVSPRSRFLTINTTVVPFFHGAVHS